MWSINLSYRIHHFSWLGHKFYLSLPCWYTLNFWLFTSLIISIQKINGSWIQLLKSVNISLGFEHSHPSSVSFTCIKMITQLWLQRNRNWSDVFQDILDDDSRYYKSKFTHYFQICLGIWHWFARRHFTYFLKASLTWAYLTSKVLSQLLTMIWFHRVCMPCLLLKPMAPLHVPQDHF